MTWISLSVAEVLPPSRPNPAEQASEEPVSRSRAQFSRQKVADQLSRSYVAGDVFISPDGPRHLARLAGSMALRVQPSTIGRDLLRNLVAVGGPLAGYTVEVQ